MPDEAGHLNSKRIHASIKRSKESERFSRYFLLLILLGVMVLFFNMISIFLLPAVFSAVFATLFYPLYRVVLHAFRQRRGLSAFATCVILLIGFLIPIYILGNIVSHQAIEFYQNAQQKVHAMLTQPQQTSLENLRNSSIVRKLHLEDVDWPSLARQVGASAGGFLARMIGRTSGTALQFVVMVFITLFIMFYFFRDGEAMIPRIKYYIPLNDKYIEEIIEKFAIVSRATIRGNLLIGLAQSTIGAFTLWIFGVGSPALWGVVMFILSLIPVLGAWLVMHPAALIQILTGHVWQGIGIFLVTILVISTIDNLMRPRLVGHYTGMHDLIVFFAAMGGIKMFGPLGVILGPIVAALFIAILDIYSREFKTHLDQHRPAQEESAVVTVQEVDPR
jgi:predicted PurR-regulated permease PerM